MDECYWMTLYTTTKGTLIKDLPDDVCLMMCFTDLEICFARCRGVDLGVVVGGVAPEIDAWSGPSMRATAKLQTPELPCQPCIPHGPTYRLFRPTLGQLNQSVRRICNAVAVTICHAIGVSGEPDWLPA